MVFFNLRIIQNYSSLSMDNASHPRPQHYEDQNTSLRTFCPATLYIEKAGSSDRTDMESIENESQMVPG